MQKTNFTGLAAFALVAGASNVVSAKAATAESETAIGRIAISTIPFDPALVITSATYTPSGKVLVAFREPDARDPRWVKLAIVDDDGRNLRPFFAQAIPARAKDNGLRYMVFADNKRIFLGDFIIECATSIDACTDPKLVPVDYPAEVADGDHVSHRWSEIIVAPDNRHIAWTTLLKNYSSIVFLGELQKIGPRYTIGRPRIISTLKPFAKDPRHPDGVLPQPVVGGEVKQFVHGGNALSVVGAVRRDTPDSVLQDLASGRKTAITDTPGYTETTIFSPDERLGITMSTRFSEKTDPAILALLPRPYPDSLNMGLSMLAYTYAVTGVRRARAGSIGPVLIDIAASSRDAGYRGANLNTEPDWVFYSPMSWHPSSTKALWVEGQRGSGNMRMQVVHLRDYRPSAAIPARALPRAIASFPSDLTTVQAFASASENIDVKIYGRRSGHIHFRRTPDGVIEKTYANFSDDGLSTYSGSERLAANPGGRSTYTANVTLAGPKPGAMALKLTFGPLGGKLPAEIISSPDESGNPLSHGYAEYDGQRLSVDTLLP